MKHLLPIILSILLLTACDESGRVQFEKLQHIDSIAELNADSAIVMLNAINRDSLWGNDNKFYFDLLKIRANDKAYIAHTSDSEILSFINYFENHDFNNLLPVAYYYGGRVYSDLGDAPQALEYFQKALDCENISEFNHLKGKISSQMGQLFINTHLFNHAREKFKDAINIYISTNDSLSLIYNYNNLGTTYKWLDMPDSSIYFTTKALNVATQIAPNSEICLLMQCHVAAFYAHKKEYNRAKIELEKCIDKLSSQNNKAYSYSIACDIYCNLNEFEKAQYYANKLLEINPSNKIAHGAYIFIAKHNNNFNLLCSHLDDYISCIDSLNSQSEKEATIHQNSLYNYSLKTKENIFLLKQQQSLKLYIFITIFFCISFILVSIIIYRNNKHLKQKLRLQLTITKQIRLKLNQLDNSPNYPIERQPSVSKLKRELIESFKIIISNHEEHPSIHPQISSSKITQKFQSLCNNNSENPSNQDWEKLDSLVNEFYPNFKSYLYILKHNLSTHLYYVCLLTKCGFSQNEIAILTNHSPNSIYSCKKRLSKSMFSIDATASDFDAFIHSL